MCPKHRSSFEFPFARTAGQEGFSIISAIFLLVVLASMGAAMLTFSNVQQTTSVQDLQGIRAYQAARAGMEWGMYQVLRVPPPPAAAPGCFANGSSVPVSGTLSGFSVSVDCSASVFTEGANSGTIYVITSTATLNAAGTQNRVERQLQVEVSR